MRVACSTVQLFHCNVTIYEDDRRAMARERTQHVAAVEELAEWLLVHTYRQESRQPRNRRGTMTQHWALSWPFFSTPKSF
jgi:hypothetical protein